MKYLKTYENYKPIIFEESTLDDVFKECSQFINELKTSPKGTFLIRSLEMSQDIVSFDHNLKNRQPADTPKNIHDILNKLFKEKFGWKVRNGVFTLAAKYPEQSIKSGYATGTKILKTGYSFTTYLFFPVDNYEMIWSPKIKDLYYFLDKKDILSPDWYKANIDFKKKYSKSAHDDDANWQIFRKKVIIEHEKEIEKMLKKLVDTYKTIDMKDIIVKKDIPIKREICIKTNKYFMVNQNHIEEIVNRIWDYILPY